MIEQRVTVQESYGYGHRQGYHVNAPEPSRTVSARHARRLIAELRGYASGFADSVSDRTDIDGSRVITATHWINGFENVRIMRVTK